MCCIMNLDCIKNKRENTRGNTHVEEAIRNTRFLVTGEPKNKNVIGKRGSCYKYCKKIKSLKWPL